jgi:hypothetical protein
MMGSYESSNTAYDDSEEYTFIPATLSPTTSQTGPLDGGDYMNAYHSGHRFPVPTAEGPDRNDNIALDPIVPTASPTPFPEEPTRNIVIEILDERYYSAAPFSSSHISYWALIIGSLGWMVALFFIF